MVRFHYPLPNNGDHSVEVRTLVCETGSMGSFPIGYPKYATLADVVIAVV